MKQNCHHFFLFFISNHCNNKQVVQRALCLQFAINALTFTLSPNWFILKRKLHHAREIESEMERDEKQKFTKCHYSIYHATAMKMRWCKPRRRRKTFHNASLRLLVCVPETSATLNTCLYSLFFVSIFALFYLQLLHSNNFFSMVNCLIRFSLINC